jgi:preprotein translocase subunit SecD
LATTPGRIRPWRYLGAFVGVVAVLYALVFFTGDGRPVPKLGIDLQGGTRVTLVARTETGGEPPREQLLRPSRSSRSGSTGSGSAAPRSFSTAPT